MAPNASYAARRSLALARADRRPRPRSEAAVDVAAATLAPTVPSSVRPRVRLGDADAEPPLADSIQQAREIDGAPRDLRLRRRHPRPVRVADQERPSRPRDRRSPAGRHLRGSPHSGNSIAVLREKTSGKRHKLRQGEQLGRSGSRRSGPGCGVHDSGLRVRTAGNSLAAEAGGRYPMTRIYRLLVAAALLGPVSPALAEGPRERGGDGCEPRRPPARPRSSSTCTARCRCATSCSHPRAAGGRCRGRAPLGSRRAVRRREPRRRGQPALLPVPAGRRPDRAGPPGCEGLQAGPVRRRNAGELRQRAGVRGLVVGCDRPGARRRGRRAPRRDCGTGRPPRHPPGSRRHDQARNGRGPLFRTDSPASPSPGIAPASPTWSRVSPPSAAARSSSARTSRAKSRPRSRISPGPRRSRPFSPPRASPPRRCRAESSGWMRRPRSRRSTRSSRWRRSHRPDQLRPGWLARQVGREHPYQGPRPGGRRLGVQQPHRHRHPEPRRQRHRLRARTRHRDAAALDPGQDHLRRPDRPRAARPQVRPGQPQPVLQQLVQRPDPAHSGHLASGENVNVVDLGGNSVSAIGNANADDRRTRRSTWSSRPASAASRSPPS